MIDARIGHLNLRLPAVFQERAGAIGREAALGLSRQLAESTTTVRRVIELKSLDVPSLSLDPALSNKRLGMQIALAIFRQLQANSMEEC